MPATTEPCAVCSKRHRSAAAAAKCAAAAASAAAAPSADQAPLSAAAVTTADVLDVLHLHDGRLVLSAAGTPLPVAASVPGLAPLPRQVATASQVVALLVDLSGADHAEVTRAFRATLRAGRSLATVIPRALLVAAADCLTLEAADIAAALTAPVAA